MKSHLLIVRHQPPHVAGSPDAERCGCAERSRVTSSGSELEPLDVHDFVSARARDRYAAQYVDPGCVAETLDRDISPSTLAASLLAEARAPGATP